MDRDRPGLRLAAGWVLGLVPGAFLALFFVCPLVAILWRGLGTDPGALADTLGGARFWRVLWFSVWQATASTAVTLLVGLAVCAVLRWRFGGRGLLRAVVTAPFVLPTVVVATAVLTVADTFGLDEDPVRLPGTAWAIVAAHAYFNVAVVVRMVGGSWDLLDDRIDTVARVLGASRMRAFTAVTLPRLRPALAAAATVVFLFSFTSFGVVLILGGGRRATLDTEIWRYATQRTDFGTAAALGLVQLVTVLVVLLAARGLRADLGTERPTVGRVGRAPQALVQRLAVWGAATAVGVVFATPLAVVVWRSLRRGGRFTLANYTSLASHDPGDPLPVPALNAVGNSLRWAALAGTIAVVLGAMAAVPRRRRGVLDLLVYLPLGTSAVLVGFGMLIGFDSSPADWRTRWWIVPVAHATVGLAFVVSTVRPALARIPPVLRQAAASLGAGPGRVWWEVDAPVARRALWLGAGFAVAVSVGEFGATAFLARPQRPTMTTAIFDLLGRPGDVAYGQALALCVVLAAISVGAVTAGDLIQRAGRRRG